jgi:hypothetical protein
MAIVTKLERVGEDYACPVDIHGHAARDPVARHEARFFGSAQAQHDPVGFVPGLGPINQSMPGLPAAPAGRHGAGLVSGCGA